jgi:hypothetical protein
MDRLIHGGLIGLAFWGLFVLVVGQARLSSQLVVRGWRARLIGLVPILAFKVPYCLGYLLAEFEPNLQMEELRVIATIIDLIVVILVFATIYSLARKWSQSVTDATSLHDL